MTAFAGPFTTGHLISTAEWNQCKTAVDEISTTATSLVGSVAALTTSTNNSISALTTSTDASVAALTAADVTINARIAAEESVRAALRVDCDDDYNAGQWLTQDAVTAWIAAGSPAGWQNIDPYLLNTGTGDSLSFHFALPWYCTPRELAMWGVQSGAPTTRAGFSATLTRANATGENLARKNFPGAGDYLQTLNPSATWFGDKGTVRVTVHGPSTIGAFQLMGVGVRFQYANRSI